MTIIKNNLYLIKNSQIRENQERMVQYPLFYRKKSSVIIIAILKRKEKIFSFIAEKIDHYGMWLLGVFARLEELP